jgi:hypothetical protein
LRANNDNTHKVDTKLVSKYMVFEKTRSDIEDLKKEIIGMKLISKEIEAKTLIYDQDFSVIKADFET